jgi:hypothetical protein
MLLDPDSDAGGLEVLVVELDELDPPHPAIASARTTVTTLASRARRDLTMLDMYLSVLCRGQREHEPRIRRTLPPVADRCSMPDFQQDPPRAASFPHALRSEACSRAPGRNTGDLRGAQV